MSECNICKRSITEKVEKFSVSKFNVAMCFDCQKLHGTKDKHGVDEESQKAADEITGKPEAGKLEVSKEEVKEYAKKNEEEFASKKPEGMSPIENLKDKFEELIVDTKGVYTKLKGTQLKLDKKGQFNYASWAQVWEEVKKIYPLANFKVYENESGMPYFFDKSGGFCKVGVTIEGLEHICYLPILNYQNKSISTMMINSFDINTTIMRCLVKACALHGLGMYVYQGEDIPKEDSK